MPHPGMQLLAVALGGAVGAVARHSIGVRMTTPEQVFPWATLLVNVLGSAALGALMAWLDRGAETEAGHVLRLAAGVGLLGSFTTFSTFSHETLVLLREGRWVTAGLSVAVHLVVCLAAAGLAWWLVDRSATTGPS